MNRVKTFFTDCYLSITRAFSVIHQAITNETKVAEEYYTDKYYEENPSNCPVCNSTRIADILYGLVPKITEELKSKIQSGEVLLGGCLVSEDRPKWACLDCRDRRNQSTIKQEEVEYEFEPYEDEFEYYPDIVKHHEVKNNETDKDIQPSSNSLPIEYNTSQQMKKTQEEKIHLSYINKGFRPSCDISFFPEDERDIILVYGGWMQALVNGDIKPLNKEQNQFIDIIKGMKLDACVDDYQKAFMKYLQRLEIVNDKDYDRIMNIKTKVDYTWADRNAYRRK